MHDTLKAVNNDDKRLTNETLSEKKRVKMETYTVNIPICSESC
jgi:hypothetical protein